MSARPPDPELKSSQFRREREASWRELEELIARFERHGARGLLSDELARLPALYRAAASSLSVARAISLDRNLRLYLESLVGRAYIAVYGTKRPPLAALRGFLARDLPRAVRRHAAFLAAAVAVLLLGIASGWLLVFADEERYYGLVPEAVAGSRTPASSTEELRSVLYHEDDGEGSGPLNVFASFLFTHNARIGILCFALGFAAGAPTVLLLFHNGLLLGAMAALYQTRDLGAEFWAWVLPHGVTELGAVCLCGTAGLAIGHALVFPGTAGRLENLARRGRVAATLVLGAVLLFLVAAAIEGFFRQLVHHVPTRWAVAAGSLALWTVYFGWSGRRRERAG